MSCRRHRIDLNMIVDHDQTAFLGHLSEFVEQVDDVDHLNLFLSNIGCVHTDFCHFIIRG
jgi:elongator complex protein 1